MKSHLLGINFIYENKPEWYSLISEILRSDHFTQLNTVNLEIFSFAVQDIEYRRILQKSELNVVDGYPIEFFILLKRRVWLKRICGSDLIYDLLEICERDKKCILLLGSTEHANRLAVENVKKQYPEINVIGYSPPFPAAESIYDDENLKTFIEQNKPSAIAVCLGPPRQEVWAVRNREFLTSNGVRLAIGLGGTVNFLSGHVKRAPCIFRTLRQEWLWRCLCEPKRIGRYIKSAWIVVKYVFFGGR